MHITVIVLIELLFQYFFSLLCSFKRMWRLVQRNRGQLTLGTFKHSVEEYENDNVWARQRIRRSVSFSPCFLFTLSLVSCFLLLFLIISFADTSPSTNIKSLTFVISPGRSGSEYISRLLAYCSRTQAYHEVYPRMIGANLQWCLKYPLQDRLFVPLP